MPRSRVSHKKGSLHWAAIASVLVIIVVIASFMLMGRGADSPSGTMTMTSYSFTGSAGMAFGVLDPRVSYGIAPYENLAVQQADLSMLVSTGAQCVRADIGYGPWLSNDQSTISLIDSVVNSIRSAGRCLIVADASSESYRNGNCLYWPAFKAAWIQRVQVLAARYHPDYYIVVKEPGWYVAMVCDATTNPAFQSASEWLGLTQTLTSTVQSASPSTIVGVSIAADGLNGAYGPFYTQYLNQVQVSFIGFDIYTSTGQTATANYLSANPPSKPVWIAEAWSAPGPGTAASAQSDALWMKSIYAFGQSIGAKMLIPFYTDRFSGYSVPTDSSSLITFYQGRTPVYTEFTDIVAGNP